MADNQYQLHQHKHVNSTNTDISDKVYLESKAKNMVNYDVINSVNVAEQFEIERQNSLSFKIYGGIEYFSPLSNVSTSYNLLSDLFTKQIPASPISLGNSFDIYLVKPYTAYTQVISNTFLKRYEVVATPSDIDLMDAGFSRNIFYEKKNIFTIPEAIELYDQVDGFGKPVTDLYLYFHYKGSEMVTKKVFGSSFGEVNFTMDVIPSTPYSKGDIIDGEVVTYEKENFFEQILDIQEHFIQVEYLEISSVNFLQFKYNPFHKIKIRDFGVDSIIQNVSATTVENIIPSYAVSLDSEGNYLWYDLLDFGYIDPIENIGVNFPFVNGSHYVFENVILTMQPDMTHTNTATVFSEISFSSNQLINTTPINGLDNAGVIC